MPFLRQRFFQVMVLFTGAVILTTSLGCQRSVSSSSLPKKKSTAVKKSTEGAGGIESPDLMTFDTGKVITGQIVRHDFVISNLSSQRIAILDDKDIRPGCGCSQLKPSARTLGPGAKATVSVSVNTQGLTGPFRRGGKITWTAEDGGKRIVTFSLIGETHPALVCTPDELHFSDNEVHRGIVKEFRVAGNVPINWSSFTATGEPSSFQIEEVRQEADSVHCLVKCTAPANLESVSGVVHLTARVADRSAVPGLDVVVAAVPLSARQIIDLQVMPQTVPLSFDARGAKGTARLLLRGERVVPGKRLVRNVRCDGYRVEWVASEPTASKTSILEITATRMAASAAMSSAVITIEFEDGQTLRLPTVAVRGVPPRS